MAQRHKPEEFAKVGSLLVKQQHAVDRRARRVQRDVVLVEHLTLDKKFQSLQKQGSESRCSMSVRDVREIRRSTGSSTDSHVNDKRTACEF